MRQINQWLSHKSARWNEYWFSETSGIGYACFRIVFGVVLLFFHIPRLFYIGQLYTREGFLYPMHQFILLHLPVPSFFFAVIINSILIFVIICFIVGYRTKIATVIILLLHFYLTLLENFSTKGFGTIMTIYLCLLLFSPSGSFLSVDNFRNQMRQWKLKGTDAFSAAQPRVRVTLQRVMLWQLALIYLFNAASKLYKGGMGWFTGQQLLRIYSHTHEFARPWASFVFSYLGPVSPFFGFLVIGTLIFIGLGLLRRDEQLYAIAFGVGYHLVTLLTTTVPYVFPFLMFSLYVIAIDSGQWDMWWNRLRAFYANKKARLFYDDECALCRYIAACIQAADVLGRVQYIGISSVSGGNIVILGNTMKREALLREMHVVSFDGSISKGFFAYRTISRMIPLFLIFVPILYIPGVRWTGERIYSLIARNRKNVCRTCA